MTVPAYDKRRLTIRFGIDPGDDIATAKRAILGAVRGVEGVLAEPAPAVRVAALGDSAVQLDLLLWIDPPRRVEALDVIDRVLVRAGPVLAAAAELRQAVAQ